MGAREVEQFLTYLAVERQVSVSTQNRAKSALLYLYRQALEIELRWLDGVVQARRPKRLPVVLTPSEVRDLLQHMSSTPSLVAELLYGTGMGLLEALRRRVKDVEFARQEIVVRAGKGNKDRVTVLPESLIYIDLCIPRGPVYRDWAGMTTVAVRAVPGHWMSASAARTDPWSSACGAVQWTRQVKWLKRVPAVRTLSDVRAF